MCIDIILNHFPISSSSRQDFEKLISKWRENEDAETENPHLISLTEILALKDKVCASAFFLLCT